MRLLAIYLRTVETVLRAPAKPGLAILALITGCAVSPPALDARDPANPSAPAGRLAGPPPSLRAGVVSYPDVPVAAPKKPADHHHHHKP
jgi:hypothetical protein